MNTLFDRLKKKPRYQWFSQYDIDADEGWYGPCATMEEAALACTCDLYETGKPVFVAQGYRMTKAEIEEECAEYKWQIDTRSAVQIQSVEII